MAGLTGYVGDASRLSRLTLRVESPPWEGTAAAEGVGGAPSGGAALVMRLPAPPGGDAAVRATLEAMRGVARHAATSPSVLRRVRPTLLWRPLGKRVALFDFLKRHVVFRRDPAGVELIRHPLTMLDDDAQLGSVPGDCDDRATLGAALALAMDLAPRFVVISTNDDPAMPWQHVYFEVRTPGGMVSIDPQETEAMGAEVPHARRMTMTV